MSNLSSTELKRLHRSWRQTAHNVAIGLDGVQGPFNVGAIIRTAAAYRATHLFVTEHATGPENKKVGKTALGCERYLTVISCSDGEDMCNRAREHGFHTVGIELATAAVPLHTVDLQNDVLLILGNEDHGITKKTQAACEQLAYIPQMGKIGSLNVATAGSIALYEWARQVVMSNE